MAIGFSPGPERRCALDRRVQRRAEARRRRRRSRTRCPRATSGARKAGVPVTMPVDVSVTSPSACEMPKSVSLAEPSAVDEDVAGLDVAVHDAGVVRRGERGGDLAADAGDLGRRAASRARSSSACRLLRRQVLHDQAGHAVVVDHVVDRHGVRVVQPGGDAGLAHRPVAGQLASASSVEAGLGRSCLSATAGAGARPRPPRRCPSRRRRCCSTSRYRSAIRSPGRDTMMLLSMARPTLSDSRTHICPRQSGNGRESPGRPGA